MFKMEICPTVEEQAKIQELRCRLEEHLQKSASLKESVKQELKKHAGDPQLLFKYIRGRKLIVDRAFDTILKYVEVKCVLYPAYFTSNQIPSFIQPSVFNRGFAVFKNKDAAGRIIILADPTNLDANLEISHMSCAIRYVIEELMNSPDFLDNGIVTIANLKGLTMRQMKNPTKQTSLMAKFFRAFPVKMKGYYCVNAPIYARPICIVAKQFAQPKIGDRLSVSSGVSELHKQISPEKLPKSLGGKLDDNEVFIPPQDLMNMINKQFK